MYAGGPEGLMRSVHLTVCQLNSRRMVPTATSTTKACRCSLGPCSGLHPWECASGTVADCPPSLLQMVGCLIEWFVCSFSEFELPADADTLAIDVGFSALHHLNIVYMNTSMSLRATPFPGLQACLVFLSAWCACVLLACAGFACWHPGVTADI